MPVLRVLTAQRSDISREDAEAKARAMANEQCPGAGDCPVTVSAPSADDEARIPGMSADVLKANGVDLLRFDFVVPVEIARGAADGG